MVAPRSTKLYQNFLIYKGVLFWVISSPTPSPTLYRRLGKTSLSLCLQNWIKLLLWLFSLFFWKIGGPNQKSENGVTCLGRFPTKNIFGAKSNPKMEKKTQHITKIDKKSYFLAFYISTSVLKTANFFRKSSVPENQKKSNFHYFPIQFPWA